jgi:hypothetical protein
MLQAKILWNKDSSMHPNDTSIVLLHAEMHILLESSEWRPPNDVE